LLDTRADGERHARRSDSLAPGSALDAARDRLAVDLQLADAAIAVGIDRDDGERRLALRRLAQAALEIGGLRLRPVVAHRADRVADLQRAVAVGVCRGAGGPFGARDAIPVAAGEAQAARLGPVVLAGLAHRQRVDPQLEEQVMPAQQVAWI